MKLNIVSIEGGLGNQMFQYAFYLGIKHTFFPDDYNEIFIAKYKHHNGYELNKVFNIKKKKFKNYYFIGFLKKTLKPFMVKNAEKVQLNYKQIYTSRNKPIIYYMGYWQSENYFKNISPLIRETFKFNDNKISEKNKNILEEIKKRNSISIHIRRGDYVNDINAKKILGDNCNLLYYQKAIEYIYSVIISPFFYIFSDEPEWVKNNFSFLENSLIIDWNKGKDSWQDMMLMSHCKHNIIANSSFSWWGAWLNNNNNKIVIAPKKWFNTFEAPYIVPNEWIRI